MQISDNTRDVIGWVGTGIIAGAAVGAVYAFANAAVDAAATGGVLLAVDAWGDALAIAAAVIMGVALIVAHLPSDPTSTLPNTDN